MALALFAVLAVVAVLRRGLWSTSSEADAWASLQAGAYAEAERIAREILARESDSAAARLIAGRAAVELGRYEDAVAYYDAVADDATDASLLARCLAADVLFLHLGRVAPAEAHLRRVLEHDPHHGPANDRLAFLLGATGRRRESLDCLLELVRHGRFTRDHLLLLGWVHAVVDEAPLLERCLEASPDDPLPLLGLARIAAHRNRPDEAEELLRRVVEVAPDQVEAQVWLGWALLEQDRLDDFRRWNALLPGSADDHPQIWFLRGGWAEEVGQAEAAVRCFAEAVRRDSEHETAMYRLARALVALDRAEAATVFQERAELLRQLGRALEVISANPAPESALPRIREVARLTESLGRLWEAWAWYQVLAAADPADHRAHRERDRLRARLEADPQTPRVVASAVPAALDEFASYPLPRFDGAFASPEDEPAGGSAGRVARFEDRAGSAGIWFTYYNGDQSTRRLPRIVETLGGGVAVLDYDVDGWPDLYCTQGCDWPPDPRRDEHHDRLYRNLGDGTFADVTLPAGLGDPFYTHGATVGDFDCDGFPDLYVTNLGGNRMYRNNGDGTFRDVTEQTGTAGSDWSTSCVLADFNGDAWPDLYVVNYLDGRDPVERICRDPSGAIRTCAPTLFAGAPDRFYQNLGDGRFEDRTAAAGIVAADGKGLGVLAARFGAPEEGHGLDLFVANDTTPNFYWRNGTETPGAAPRFDERGLASGLALDRDGRAQSCMGIAAGDADGDGRLDLFVTNFYDESNTLYLQHASNLFLDATRDAELRTPSYWMLGFGTQFLDAELDGLADLVIANGHIDDLRDRGVPFEMPPQYFRNTGAARFVEQPAETIGPYFRGRYLGRGLARLDWNRDGREDFTVSHLDAPLALLTNETQHAGRFLAVRLRGVVSSRDAVGTILVLTAEGRGWTRQLTAGDGYLASNERQIVFGLGSRERVESLRVFWPSGLEQTFENVPLDAHVLVIEGRDELIAARPDVE